MRNRHSRHSAPFNTIQTDEQKTGKKNARLPKDSKKISSIAAWHRRVHASSAQTPPTGAFRKEDIA